MEEEEEKLQKDIEEMRLENEVLRQEIEDYRNRVRDGDAAHTARVGAVVL